MYDFDKLIPCDKPFVLAQDDAIAYLKHQVNLLYEQSIAHYSTMDIIQQSFAEYVSMAQQIIDNGWKYVLFYGEDMADSGIAIAEMCKRGEE